MLFKSSRCGIGRLEICESKEDKNPKIITLENCVKITQEPSPANIICIVKKTGTLTLNAINEDDLKEWVNALQTVAFRNKNDNIQTISAIEEDNDLYCSSYGDGLFIVTLIPSEASIRCSIEPKTYMLHLTATELQLKTISGLKSIISNWPYRFIRKYGYRDGKFTFEAGRKCSTGEGVFTLDHSNPQEVFRCMSSKMKCMKKLISGDVVNVDSCENLLSAAASMEPGSRSPLPPSLSTQHSSEFEVSSNQSSICLSDSLNNFSQVIIQTSKFVPNKPPRKIVTNVEKSVAAQIDNYHNAEKNNKCNNFNPVTITTTVDPNKSVGSTVILKPPSPNTYRSKNDFKTSASDLNSRNFSHTERDYECIENITDAWKTMGINDVKHNETVRTLDNNTFNDIVWSREKILNPREKIKDSPHLGPNPKIVDIDIGESNTSSSNIQCSDFTYDRLNFLSANNKTSSGYKTVVCVTSLANQLSTSNPVQNEYELIGVPDAESCRKADDKHLGYGVLRKLTLSPETQLCTQDKESTFKGVDTTTIDSNYNGQNYMEIRKPKRIP